MAGLFTDIHINEMNIKNRIVMAPMVMNQSDDSGLANDFHFVHYVTRAVGGTGTIILEATAVEPRGRITNRDLGIWSDAHIAPLRRIVQECKKYGAVVGIQLAHAGRKCAVSTEESIAPSELAFDENYPTPKEMTLEEIQTVIASFKEGARRAAEAGFDFVELHGAHGYLMNEFISPLTNHRRDGYGSPTAFLGEVIENVRDVMPSSMPIYLRVSGHEYAEGGNTPEDIGMILNEVKRKGLDVIHVSSGAVVPAVITPYPGYQVHFAEKIKEITRLPVIAGGLVTEPTMAEEMIQNNRCDFVFLARELLRQPYWPLQAAKELGYDMVWPSSYVRGKK